MNLEIRRDDWRSLAGYASIPSRYDALPGNGPLDWPNRFDVTGWILLSAWTAKRRVGGAIVVVEPDAAKQLGGSERSAMLWDIRVAEDARRRGIARALIEEAARIARVAGCDALEVETQDVNAAACRLYSATGFDLSSIEPDAYPELPDETRLIWSRPL